MVNGGQLWSIVVSCGQLWSVPHLPRCVGWSVSSRLSSILISCGQLQSVVVSCGQWWSVAVSCGQFRICPVVSAGQLAVGCAASWSAVPARCARPVCPPGGVPTESGEDGRRPEDLAQQGGDVEQTAHPRPVTLLERVQHRHVALRTHLAGEEQPPCNHTTVSLQNSPL